MTVTVTLTLTLTLHLQEMLASWDSLRVEGEQQAADLNQQVAQNDAELKVLRDSSVEMKAKHEVPHAPT